MNNKFSDRLKEIRQSNNMTQKELAEIIGVTPASLSAYESDSQNPSLDVAKRIAQVFNVTLDWLCGIGDTKDFKPQTLGDIVKMIAALCDHADGFLFSRVDSFEGHVTWGIGFDSALDLFLEEYNGIRDLYNNRTIDDDLYNLWIEKRVSMYSAIKLPKKKEELSDDLPF